MRNVCGARLAWRVVEDLPVMDPNLTGQDLVSPGRLSSHTSWTSGTFRDGSSSPSLRHSLSLFLSVSLSVPLSPRHSFCFCLSLSGSVSFSGSVSLPLVLSVFIWFSPVTLTLTCVNTDTKTLSFYPVSLSNILSFCRSVCSSFTEPLCYSQLHKHIY